MTFTLSFILGLSMSQSAAARDVIPLKLVVSPGWSIEQYQNLIAEMSLYNVDVELIENPISITDSSESGFWLYHGLAGPYFGLHTPKDLCGLILLGVPTQVPQTSLLPNIPTPSPQTEMGDWFKNWRIDTPPPPSLPSVQSLVLSSTRDYLAPPEYSYKGPPTVDFVRFSPINALPEPTHLDFVGHPMTARIIGRWINDHSC